MEYGATGDGVANDRAAVRAGMSTAATRCTAPMKTFSTPAKSAVEPSACVSKTSLRVNCSKRQIQLSIRESPAQDDD
jgi:hypothetical protein